MPLIKVNEDKLKQIKETEVSNKRIVDYSRESDPLFFKAQRGEVPMQEWLDKIEEIKKRHPKPL